jgi:diguanylate cyclase (GGDEF)-like protein
VGRLGGDEFVVLLESAADDLTPNLLADRLTDVLREPVELDDSRKLFSVSASIGVSSGHYATPDALLRDADLALYAAKAAGKDRYALFDPTMDAGVLAFNGGERPKRSEDPPAPAPPRAKAA